MFQPGVPGDADIGDLGDLFASQAGDPSAVRMPVLRHAYVDRPQPGPLRAEKGGQFRTACRLRSLICHSSHRLDSHAEWANGPQASSISTRTGRPCPITLAIIASRQGESGWLITKEETVLVIGATGQQGGATARHLLERDRTVRALVRAPDSPAARALRRAGADLARGDLDDPASLRAAMEGAHGVFLVLTMMVGPRISPEGVVAEERRGQAVADLARETGIEHLVYSSLNGAGARSGIPYYESKARIEEHIHALGLPATILRPVSFMDNFATYSRPVRGRRRARGQPGRAARASDAADLGA